MGIEIIQPSPEALEAAKELGAKFQEKRYPFDELETGKSFRLPKAEANIQSLKTIASRKSKNGSKFIVQVHEFWVEVYKAA